MKIRRLILINVILLCVIVAWKYVVPKTDASDWVENFEERLHHQENKADSLLSQVVLSDTLVVDDNIDADLILVGFENKEIVCWSEKRIGCDNLYVLLKGKRFVTINNTYYEVRYRATSLREYFVLIYIRDNYPYENDFIYNRFGSFFGISKHRVPYLGIEMVKTSNNFQIKNVEGYNLFCLNVSREYQKPYGNYFLAFFCFLFTVMICRLFKRLMREAVNMRRQLYYIVGFMLFMTLFHIVVSSSFIADFLCQILGLEAFSSGEMVLTTLILMYVIYVIFSMLKINDDYWCVGRRKLWLCISLLSVLYLYYAFLSVIHVSFFRNNEVNVYIAYLVRLSSSSIAVFLSVVASGVGIILFIEGIINVLGRLYRPFKLLLLISIINGVLALVSLVLGSYVVYMVILVWVFMLLSVLTLFCSKKEMQHSIRLFLMFLYAVFVVVLCEKMLLHDQEERFCNNYAEKLLEERDFVFERNLEEIDSIIINQSNRELIAKDVLKIPNYNYTVHLERGTDLSLDRLIGQRGKQIGKTQFYVLDVFDGFYSYIGKYNVSDTVYYLRYDSEIVNERDGYMQILSVHRKRQLPYHYSYAKYKEGVLIATEGIFNYYRRLDKYSKDTLKGSFVINKYLHRVFQTKDNSLLIVSMPLEEFGFFYMNIPYVLLMSMILYTLVQGLDKKRWRALHGSLKSQIKNRLIMLIIVLFLMLTALSVSLFVMAFEKRLDVKLSDLLKRINRDLEAVENTYANVPFHISDSELTSYLEAISKVQLVDINIYSKEGKLKASSRPKIFSAGFEGFLIDPRIFKLMKKDDKESYVIKDYIGDLPYRSIYVPISLSSGESFILNIPYFEQDTELKFYVMAMLIIAINIAIIIIVLGYLISGAVADRVTRPLQAINESLRRMRISGINEMIDYGRNDEIGHLVLEYNNMILKLEDNVRHIARLERENAWREMAHQIAHEIKNPLTPMKLNIQYLQRLIQTNNVDVIREKSNQISKILIEQIDTMASIATTFSDFAKIAETKKVVFCLNDAVISCVELFKNDGNEIAMSICDDVYISAGKEQIHRMLVNLLKNAEQSIPEDREGRIEVLLAKEGVYALLQVSDNGSGIPEELREKIFEPNFTTKSSGTGLGLAISRKIVENAGGTISFESDVMGTTFFVRIPLFKGDIHINN